VTINITIAELVFVLLGSFEEKPMKFIRKDRRDVICRVSVVAVLRALRHVKAGPRAFRALEAGAEVEAGPWTFHRSGDNLPGWCESCYCDPCRCVEAAVYPRGSPTMTVEERNALVVNNVRLAYWCVHKVARRRDRDLPDLLQVACMTLVRCAELFDPSRGAPFAAYAAKAIIRRVLLALRERDRLPAEQLASEGECAAPEDADGADVLQRLELGRRLDALTPADRELIDARFYRGETYSVMAGRLRLSKQRVQQKVARVLERLRRRGLSPAV
jgi:RNA polymerase sigma factor (sigma-70 family)